MRRFWVDKSCKQNKEFVLKDDLYHHVCRVCRFKKGEKFELFAEGTQKYLVELTSIFASKAQARILKEYPVPSLKKPYIHLALSIPRLNKMDFIIEKSVELGVKEIHPFYSEFSFVKKSNQIKEKRESRWESLGKMACALSGRTELIQIAKPCAFKDLMWPENSNALMAFTGKKTLSLKEVLHEGARKNSVFESVWIFIGSEGGFSDQEADLFVKKGGKIFSLGEQILKVETACLTSLSILKYHYHLKGCVS